MCQRRNRMLYLEEKRNRVVFMTISTITSVAFSALLIQGINAVGVLMAAAIINIFVYYALPDRHSKAHIKKYQKRSTAESRFSQ